MTKDEIIEMALEALNDLSAWNDGEVGGHMDEPYSAEVARRTITAIKEALAQEQEPMAWISAGPARMIHWTSDKPAYGDDWVPLYTNPPQRTERPVDCERCNRLEEQAYDLVGKLRVANIKLSMRLPRTWVELTDDEIWEAYMKAPLTLDCSTDELYALARTVEAKLKEKNT